MSQQIRYLQQPFYQGTMPYTYRPTQQIPSNYTFARNQPYQNIPQAQFPVQQPNYATYRANQGIPLNTQRIIPQQYAPQQYAFAPQQIPPQIKYTTRNYAPNQQTSIVPVNQQVQPLKHPQSNQEQQKQKNQPTTATNPHAPQVNQYPNQVPPYQFTQIPQQQYLSPSKQLHIGNQNSPIRQPQLFYNKSPSYNQMNVLQQSPQGQAIMSHYLAQQRHNKAVSQPSVIPLLSNLRGYASPNKLVSVQSPNRFVQVQSPNQLVQMQSPSKIIQMQSPNKLVQVQSPGKQFVYVSPGRYMQSPVQQSKFIQQSPIQHIIVSPQNRQIQQINTNQFVSPGQSQIAANQSILGQRFGSTFSFGQSQIPKPSIILNNSNYLFCQGNSQVMQLPINRQSMNQAKESQLKDLENEKGNDQKEIQENKNKDQPQHQDKTEEEQQPQQQVEKLLLEENEKGNDEKPNSNSIQTDKEFENGEKYSGEMINNLRQGYGIQLSKEGKSIYKGYWKNDKYEGFGQLINQSEIHESEKVNYKDINNIEHLWICYDGEFYNGQFNGRGCLQFTNNARFDGQFVDGKMSGEGQYLCDGEEINGVWENNIFQEK